MTITKDQVQQTALMLWNAGLRAQLQEILFMKTNESATQVTMKNAIARTQRAIEAAEHFTVTKHRIIVDAIIKELNFMSEHHKATIVELNKTVRWKFARVKALKAIIHDNEIRMEATKAALLIAVNTTPPKMANGKHVSMNGQNLN